jgi:hypothetical protein
MRRRSVAGEVQRQAGYHACAIAECARTRPLLAQHLSLTLSSDKERALHGNILPSISV